MGAIETSLRLSTARKEWYLTLREPLYHIYGGEATLLDTPFASGVKKIALMVSGKVREANASGGGNEGIIFETDGDFGSEEQRNSDGIAISHVGDLSISRSGDLSYLAEQQEKASGVKVFGGGAIYLLMRINKVRNEFTDYNNIFGAPNTFFDLALSSSNYKEGIQDIATLADRGGNGRTFNAFRTTRVKIRTR